ncbi:hypothetical protein CL6EHI_004060 [Entamoeba histolytica]|uniref:Uncharacterized protein n=2 Tax=Entamoeba histolytica TaxID=5759 RepID=B1N5C6_ENTH1|nr:hypothetical protein EHI_004060 [Entamoeba histolytica HM-1:IMSS]EDS88833.1 hypothetical protein EHI_004060 [Entamoeba histolytica HM-1:IMSS]GAT99415.1 hypothetical protein CL6EHI_004060 [Entamoeba histolytica]|eukprot:XP_001914392.1 hypothetical protein EHI_004060 [Entamoeba histolytica HM-1:IMSS]
MIGLLIVFVVFASAKEFYKYTYTGTGDNKKIASYVVYEVDKCYRISATTYQSISQHNGETPADEGKYFYGTFTDKECKTSSDVKQYTVEELKTKDIFETKPEESNQCKEVAASQFVDDKCEDPIPGGKQFVCNVESDVKTCISSGNEYTQTGVVHGYQGTFHYSDSECTKPTGFVEDQRKCGVCSPSSMPSSSDETITYTKVTCENDC